MNSIASTNPAGQEEKAVLLQAILNALHDLRFGSVTLVVQDGVVVQVERIEKTRLARHSVSSPK